MNLLLEILRPLLLVAGVHGAPWFICSCSCSWPLYWLPLRKAGDSAISERLVTAC
jgi:hypothetical protein